MGLLLLLQLLLLLLLLLPLLLRLLVRLLLLQQHLVVALALLLLLLLLLLAHLFLLLLLLSLLLLQLHLLELGLVVVVGGRQPLRDGGGPRRAPLGAAPDTQLLGQLGVLVLLLLRRRECGRLVVGLLGRGLLLLLVLGQQKAQHLGDIVLVWGTVVVVVGWLGRLLIGAAACTDALEGRQAGAGPLQGRARARKVLPGIAAVELLLRRPLLEQRLRG